MQCKAHVKSTGAQCKRAALSGATVCIMHGASAPQVKRKAAERLAALVNPAIDRMTKLIKSDDESVALAASKDILDRTQGKAAQPLTGADGEGIQVVVTHIGQSSET